MILTKEQIKEFGEAVKPAMKWLNENCSPHSKIIVEVSSAEVVENVCSEMTAEFLKD